LWFIILSGNSGFQIPSTAAVHGGWSAELATLAFIPLGLVLKFFQKCIIWIKKDKIIK
jgi:hypothetical protein